jgi:hypothetical protein
VPRTPLSEIEKFVQGKITVAVTGHQEVFSEVGPNSSREQTFEATLL